LCLVERALQRVGDLRRIAAFDLVSLQYVDPHLIRKPHNVALERLAHATRIKTTHRRVCSKRMLDFGLGGTRSLLPPNQNEHGSTNE
jgi:hypothetical protein